MLAALLIAAPLIAAAQTAASNDNTARNNPQNDANNPLAPKAALQFQDYFQPVLNGQTGSGANQGILRGVLPHEELGLPQLARASLPAVSTAYGPDGSITGLGDLTVFDVPVFVIDKVKVGAGPLVVVPTSTSPALGTGKWQAGGQTIFNAPHDWGLTAGFVSYQQSFDGAAQTITAQPLLFYNLDDGYYLRSSGIASFDLVHHTSVVPVGLGFERAIPLPDGRVLNAFVEPQYSAVRSGVGVPAFQVFFGFNIQFPPGAQSH